MRLLALVLAAAALSLYAQAPAHTLAPDAAFAPISFLLGTWSATTGSGTANAKAIGNYTFAPDLAGHIVSRIGSLDSCTGPKTFDCQHHDQLTLYPDPATKSLIALYLDSEGHVIHYAVTAPDPATAVFLSTDPGPHFRLTYHREGNTMTGKFQFAPPGSDDFHSYLEWTGTKQ